MIRHFQAACVAIAASLPSVAVAAPPKLDYLFPAGGQRGTTVTITAAGTFERWPVKAYIDGKGIEIKPGKTKGALTIIVAKGAEPGVHWLRLYDEQGTSMQRPFIVGLLPEAMEKEPNDDPKNPHVLDSPNVTVNGRLDKTNEVDTFAVKLSKGQTLVASMEAYHTLRSPMDAVLQVLSADGFVLEQNDDYHDRDPQIVFTAPKDAIFLVRTFAFPFTPDSSIRFAGKETFVYRLTLTTGPFVDYAYPLAVARSTPAAVELVGWNIPDDLRKFPVVPRQGPDLLKLFHPRIANPFFVRLEPNAVIAKTKATRADPLTISPPQTIGGRLDKPGDIDVYQFDAKKGQKLAIRIEARTLGFPLDAVLRVTDGGGTTISQAQAGKIGSEPKLDFTPTQDGAFRLEVSDLAGQGGRRHVYLLRIGAIAPDFELKVAADAFALPPGGTLDIPVAITRVAGFKQNIALSVAGLPKKIAVTATTKAITLRSTGKTPFAGPIRIVGTAADGTKRFAVASLPEFDRVTASLWLTETSTLPSKSTKKKKKGAAE